MQTESNKYPLVSIFSFVKNRAKSVRRSIDSILAQDYPNIEIIVQDGESTDGTLELLKSYGDQINLVSEPDSGPGDAFFRCLSRVRGEFFGSCLSDEELLPNAVSWAVRNLTENPELAAIYGDHYNTDCDGNITGWVKAKEWDYEKYICSEIMPPFSASFFRKKCYDAVKLSQYSGCGEFEIWARLGAVFPIRHISCFVSKYAVHPAAYSYQAEIREELMTSRKAAIERLCNNTDTPEPIRLLKDKAIASLYPWHVINYCNMGIWDMAKRYAPLAYKNGPNRDRLDLITEHFQKRSAELEQQEKIEDALEYLDLLLEAGENRPNFNYRRANILLRLGRTIEAAKAGSEELKLQPDHHKSKAIIRLAKSCPEGILQPHQDKIAEELLKMGIEFMRDGNLQEALNYFNEVHSDCPDMSNLNFAMAAAYTQAGKLYSALQACETELRFQPEHSGAKNLLERLRQAINEYERNNNQITTVNNENSSSAESLISFDPRNSKTNLRDEIISPISHSIDQPKLLHEPKFSFVMIVLNGMPFIEYSLKSVYDFAHEIIIIEGAVENCMFAANPDGSSTDGTVEFIQSFPDPQNKIRLIQGRWPEKCEMQNEALKYVTGDYIWLIDSDEVYKREHLEKIKEIIKKEPSITQVNFIPDNFWKGLEYIFVSPAFYKQWCHYRRLFKYVPGALFTSHRPPTMLWPDSDKTTEQMHLLDGTQTKQMGIIFYHYSYVLDKQVKQKIELYCRYGWGKNWNIDLLEWYKECFLKWMPANRQEIDSKYPIWTGDINSQTVPFEGSHPEVMESFRKSLAQKACQKEPSELTDKVSKKVKIAADYVKTGVNVGAESSFGEKIQELFSKIKPRKIIETGTYLGTGTTTIITKSLQRLGIVDAIFFTIEVNPKNYTRAKQYFETNNIKVNALNGLSVPRAMLPSKEEIARKTITDIDYDGIFVDHKEENRAELYYNETNFPSLPDDLLYQCLKVFDFKPDFVLLDSGGHMGNIEFNHLIDNLQGECYIALDDIYHVKHHHSFQEIQKDKRFELITHSKEKFGFCIAKFTPKHKKLDKDTHLPVNVDNFETGNTINQIIHAQTLLNQGHIVKALKEFEKILIHSQDSIDAHFGRAVCLARLGRLLEAEVEAKNALNKDPENPDSAQFAEQIHRLKPDLKGDRDVEWGSTKSLLTKMTNNHNKGSRLLDFGCGQTAELTRFATQLGYRITAIDMTPLTVSLDGLGDIHFIQGDFLQQDWTPQSYDLIINCSSVEHSGLVGRYGVTKEGIDDDLEIMNQMSKIIKPDGKMLLTIPVGLDMVVGSLHRVYGQTRLVKLLKNWEIESSCFWIKDENNQWREVDEESALQREPMLAYSLGCFMLRPVAHTSSSGDRASTPTYGHQSDTFVHNEDKTNIDVTALKTAVQAISKQQHKVLIVKTDGIGDFVIFSGALPYYRKLYPNSHIAIIVRECTIELAEACPYIDEVIVNHRKSMVYDQNYAADFMSRIQAAKYDVAICPVYSRDKVTDFIVINSGAKEKIASVGDDTNMPAEQVHANNPYFTKLIPAKAGKMLETERNSEFVEGLGLSVIHPYETTLWLEPEHRDYADKLLKDLNIQEPMIICPFAQYEKRNWPDSKWAELMSCLKNYPILICGSKQSSQNAENIIKTTEHPNVRNFCGKTSLRQLAALLERAKLCIGVESAPVHIAATVNCPHVVIIGGGHFGRFMPYSPKTSLVYTQMDCYGCNWRCKYGQDIRCINTITVEMIEQAVNSWLTKIPDSSIQNSKTGKEHAHEKQYLVSAIVSTYNSENFIHDCLEDLEKQTISEKVEIIVIDSGSQQNEGLIVKEFQKKYNNIKYIKTEKRETIYAAWNRGIKIATGKYITNANTDDRHRPDALEIMAKALDANQDKVMVYANQVEVSETDGRRVAVGERINGEFSRDRLFSGQCFPGSQPMWRKEVHNVLGYFDEGFMISGDYEFWFRLTQKYNFLYINETLGERLLSPDAVCKSNSALTSYENIMISKCYNYALQACKIIDWNGISNNPLFSNWPEIQIWKKKVLTKIAAADSRTDYIKNQWDLRGGTKPKLSVVIVTYNKPQQLNENLNALQNQTETDFEIIVISNDGELSELKTISERFKCGLCCIELSKNLGPSYAKNTGASKARADYFAFLDDDAVPDKNFVANILANFAKHNICGLRGKVLPKSSTDSQTAPASYDLGDNVIHTTCEVSSHCAFRKDIFCKVDGYDTDLFGNENRELSYRIYKSLNEKINCIIYAPDVIVYHEPKVDFEHRIEKNLREKEMLKMARKKWPDIELYLQYIRSLYPQNARIFEKDYLKLLSNCLFLQENSPQEAAEWALKAVNLEPDLLKGRYLLGTLYAKLGKFTEAEILLESVFSSVMQSDEFIERKLKTSSDVEKNKTAQIDCYISTGTKLAQCYLNHGKYDKVKQIYHTLLNDNRLNMPQEQTASLKAVLAKLENAPSLPAAPQKSEAISESSAGPESRYLVSAIVSTYNAEKFLRGCMDDLVQQTIADKLEIVIVNSGSEQNEDAIVREYQNKYNNISYIKTDCREGIYTAWNRAVRVARGKYLTNANTDDRHRKDALEIMARTLEKNPEIALIYGDQICTDTPNGTFENHNCIELAKRSEYSKERLLFGCCVGSQPMWRKTLHDELGFFDESLACSGDWDFWLRTSQKYDFKHIPEFLGLYYYNRDGIEHGRRIHSWYERYKVGRRYGREYLGIFPIYQHKDNPLVSIIMPVYNMENYIIEAIESILIQNYMNFELIVVDDGSTDHTKDAVLSFGDPRIKYFYKENGGPYTARNLGMKKASGDFIVPLDADDMMTPDYISSHLKEFEKCPDADLIYCDDYLIDTIGRPTRVIERPEYTDRKYLIRDLFHCGFPVVPFRTCIRKSVFDKIGKFDDSFRNSMDYDMIRLFVKHGLKAHHLKAPLYLRRMVLDSVSRKPSHEGARANFEVLKRFTESFSYDELFPDVAWDKIAPEKRSLHAKCLVAATYLSIGQNFINSNSSPVYAKKAFEQAWSELNECLKMDPNNDQIRQLLQKCDLGRQKYAEQMQTAIY